MADKPAVLIPDEFIQILSQFSLCKVSFQELAGTQYPWEVKFHAFQEIRARLGKIERALRSANPVLDITCILTGQGAFWMPQEGLDNFFQKLHESDNGDPNPVWKLTSSEMFTSHVSNMRQLILASAHDMVLLDHLKNPLGNNHILFQREFEHCERHVRTMLDEIADQGGNLEFITSKDVLLLERVRVTQEMLDRGTIQQKELGYSPQELQRVQKILEQRCDQEFPKYRQRLQGAYNQIKNSLRDGESTELRRVSHWEMAFAMIGSAPIGFRGHSQLATVERRKISEVVAAREAELGISESGQSALAAAEESRQQKEPYMPPPPVEEPEPAVEVEEETPVQREKRHRMAYMDRRNR